MTSETRSKPRRLKLRLCAICGQRTGAATWGFPTFLARNGIKGDKAHTTCIAKLKDRLTVTERKRLEKLRGPS